MVIESSVTIAGGGSLSSGPYPGLWVTKEGRSINRKDPLAGLVEAEFAGIYYLAWKTGQMHPRDVDRLYVWELSAILDIAGVWDDKDDSWETLGELYDDWDESSGAPRPTWDDVDGGSHASPADNLDPSSPTFDKVLAKGLMSHGGSSPGS